MARSSALTLTSLGLTVVVVLCLISGDRGTGLVAAWPGGSAMYECCCPESYGCRRNCFMCRNVAFVCNCDLCSCYLDSGGPNDVSSGPSKNELLAMLLRNGAASKNRKNWPYGPGR